MDEYIVSALTSDGKNDMYVNTIRCEANSLQEAIGIVLYLSKKERPNLNVVLFSQGRKYSDMIVHRA